ncbi:MAG TPA: PAS domain S-box protein [Steroidobacteraceae bacterium]
MALTGLALLIRALLPVPVGTTIYQLPLAAVVLSGWLGGRGPGLLATSCSVAVLWYWFIPPVGTWEIAPEFMLALCIFVALCLLLTELGEARWRVKRALEASERQFRLMAETVPEVLFLQSVQPAQLLYVSPRYEEIWGRAVGDLKNSMTGWLDAIHPDDEGAVRSTYQRWLSGEGGSRIDATFRIVRPDGETRWIRGRGSLIRDEQGKPYRGSGVAADITDEKHTQDALAAAQAELRARQEMLDLAQKAARAVAFDWHIGARESENSWSPDLEAMYGLDPGAFDRTFEGWKKLVHPDDWPSVKVAIRRAQQTGDIAAEYRVIYKDGSVHWLQAKGRMFSDAEGRPDRMVGFMIDITDWKHAEEELRATEARFRTFVDHAADAFYLMDEQLRIVDVNRQACQSLGWNREQLIGMHPREFDVGLDEASIVRLAQRTAAGEITTFETRHRRRDGSEFPVEIRTATFRQAGKLFYLSLGRDITERKRAEERLREQEGALQTARIELARVSRITTLGELSAAIGHEVSQPLGAMIASVGACTRWLAAEPPNIAEARAVLDNIAADSQRAREIIARIRALTKRQLPRKELLDVNRKVRDVLQLADHELRSHEILLRTELDETLPHVTGDRVQLQQVLLNLIMNAIDAMRGIGDRPRALTIASGRDGADSVLVEVRDSGTGLDPKGAERLFEAFYTTKAGGVGIGLSIARSIVEAHGGRLWAGPNEPHGAIFRFSLPVAEDEQ